MTIGELTMPCRQGTHVVKITRCRWTSLTESWIATQYVCLKCDHSMSAAQAGGNRVVKRSMAE
jgi:hypothetical protein